MGGVSLEALKRCCSDGERRPELMKPFLSTFDGEAATAATDGTFIVAVSGAVDGVADVYGAEPGSDPAAAMARYVGLAMGCELTSRATRDVLLEWVGDEASNHIDEPPECTCVLCKTCDGGGNLYCDACGNYDQCADCDRHGYLGYKQCKKHSPVWTAPDNAKWHVTYDGQVFDARLVANVFLALPVVDEYAVGMVVTGKDKYRALIVQCDGAGALVMPVRANPCGGMRELACV